MSIDVGIGARVEHLDDHRALAVLLLEHSLRKAGRLIGARAAAVDDNADEVGAAALERAVVRFEEHRRRCHRRARDLVALLEQLAVFRRRDVVILAEGAAAVAEHDGHDLDAVLLHEGLRDIGRGIRQNMYLLHIFLLYACGNGPASFRFSKPV